MSSRRFKTIILLMLLAANLCLLAATLPIYWQRAHQSTALSDALLQLLEQQQIEFDPVILPEEQTLYELELTYSTDAEFAAVNVLLPGARADVTSPYETRWNAETGTCVVTVSGSLSAQMTQPLAQEPIVLLEQMGFTAAATQRGVYSVTVWQQVAGAKVLSPLKISLEDSKITTLEGCFLLFQGAPLRASLEPSCTAADAVVAFLAQRNDLGWVGQSITALEQGYVPGEHAASLRLRPVWRIQTDTAQYEVDGLTRSVSLVE